MTTMRVRLLGTAQDGGVPQFGCVCANCRRARTDSAFRRTPASLLLSTPDGGFRLLLDPSPELPRQFDAALAADPMLAARPAIDAIAVTHLHWGHWVGLGWFGREVLGSRRVPVFASQAVIDFMAQHPPTQLAFRFEHLVPMPLEFGSATTIGPVALTAIRVPHRSEYADSAAFLLEWDGRGRVMWCPDIDRWPAADAVPRLADWATRHRALVLADATFGSRTELPGRDMTQIPHPTAEETIKHFAPAVAAGSTVALIHFNHSNPLADGDGELARSARSRGFLTPADGDTWIL